MLKNKFKLFISFFILITLFLNSSISLAVEEKNISEPPTDVADF